MKKSIVILFSMLVSFSLFASDISLVSMTGYVQIKKNEKADWTTPKKGQKLSPGFIIYTGFNSSAVIKTDDAKIEVKPLSQISISSLIATTDKVATDIYLKYGKIKADVNTKKETQTLFKVRSANSTASVRGTVFSFGEDSLFVEAGTVHLLNNEGFSTLVQKNEYARAQKMNFIQTPFQSLKDAADVNILPTGMSDSEMGNLTDITSGRVKGKAKVIIRINVVQ